MPHSRSQKIRYNTRSQKSTKDTWVAFVGDRIPMDPDIIQSLRSRIRMDLLPYCEGGSMIPVDLSANCEGWIYDPHGSGIQILGIRSRDPFSGSTDTSAWRRDIWRHRVIVFFFVNVSSCWLNSYGKFGGTMRRRFFRYLRKKNLKGRITAPGRARANE